MKASEFSAEKFLEVSQEALSQSAVHIRKAMLGYVDAPEYKKKEDKSILTPTDVISQNIARPIILEGLPDIRLVQEESDKDLGNLESEVYGYFDPLDGSRPFLMGGVTSTNILGLWDSKNKEILAVSTMEPMSGRFWHSTKGKGTYLSVYDYTTGEFDEGRQLHVSDQEFSGSRVFIDATEGFARKVRGTGEKRQVFYNQGRRELTNLLQANGANEISFFSNGSHYAVVSLGRPLTAVCITSAIGGPYDITGMLHVIESGGVAQCYGIREEGGKRGIYEMGQNIKDADLAVAANTQKNLDMVAGILNKAANYRS